MRDAKEVCANTRMTLPFSQWQLYVMPSWFGVPKESAVSQMDCAFADFQEPYGFAFLPKCRYVILKYTPSTPLFDERFVNYGFNKIQFVEHLRAANYHFFILNHAFMVDLSHAEYSFELGFTVDRCTVLILLKERTGACIDSIKCFNISLISGTVLINAFPFVMSRP